MLKALSTFTVLMMGFSAATAQAENWQCYTEPLTTSFVAEDLGEEYQLTVLHHNGVKYMPIHSGIITPSDLTYLKAQGEVLTKLGDRFTLKFKKENCKNYGEWRFSCFTRETTKIGSLEVQSAHLSTSTNLQQIFDYEFREVEVHLSLRIEGRSHSIPMKFSDTQCHR